MLDNIKKLYNEWLLKDARKYETGEIKHLKYKYMKNRKDRLSNGKKVRRLNNSNKYHQIREREDVDETKPIRQPYNSYKFKKNYKIKKSNPSGGMYKNGGDKRFSKIINGIRDIFTGETTNMSNSNLSIVPNVNKFNSMNNYEMIKQQIKDSRAFQTKLNELQYDKLQINKLRQIRKREVVDEDQLGDNKMNYSILNDRYKLLQKENESLKIELYKKDSEIEILQREIQFLKDNSKIIARDNLIDLLDVKSNYLNEVYDTNLNVSPLRGCGSRTRSRSFSPVRVDLSQYSK